MATIIWEDGRMESLEYEGAEPTLEQLQEIVGGYIQVVPTPDNKLLVVNEEGKFKPHKKNEYCTEMMTGWLLPGDYIAGNAVLLELNEMS